MNRHKRNRWMDAVLGSMLLFVAGAPMTWAQEDASPQPRTPETEVESTLPDSEQEAPPEGLADDPVEPVAPVEGATDAEATSPGEAAPVGASLERFVPSEQISEDNSVAYPNDI